MDEKLLGKCGYYCGQCISFITGKCTGCIDGNKKGICYARDCVMERSILSCVHCQEFPCERIQSDPKASLLNLLWLKWMASQRDR